MHTASSSVRGSNLLRQLLASTAAQTNPADVDFKRHLRVCVLVLLRGAGQQVVFLGDSLLRHLFKRLVHLLRGMEEVKSFPNSPLFCRC